MDVENGTRFTSPRLLATILTSSYYYEMAFLLRQLHVVYCIMWLAGGWAMANVVLLLLSSPGIAVGALVTVHRIREFRRDPVGGTFSGRVSWLASQGEEETFRQLRAIFPSDKYLISAHMLLADVIGRNQLRYLSDLDREFAWKAHCDFVVVRVDDLTIEQVVEVNGAHHQSPIQMARDRQKQQILRRFGIRLEVIEIRRHPSARFTGSP